MWQAASTQQSEFAASAGLQAQDILVDLYCGVGALGITAAVRQNERGKPLKMLYGYDIYNQAIRGARTNAKLRGLGHKTYQFRSGDLGQPTLGAPADADVIISGGSADIWTW